MEVATRVYLGNGSLDEDEVKNLDEHRRVSMSRGKLYETSKEGSICHDTSLSIKSEAPLGTRTSLRLCMEALRDNRASRLSVISKRDRVEPSLRLVNVKTGKGSFAIEYRERNFAQERNSV